MDNVPQPKNTNKPRKPSTLRILFQIDGTEYAVVPLRAHPAVAVRAVRLVKHGAEPATYDVSVTEHGPQCECKGFLRWQKPCKHIRALSAAGMIEAVKPLPLASVWTADELAPEATGRQCD